VARPLRASTKYIVWHCSATDPDRFVDAAQIDQWHRERGWQGIGYHFVILRDGTVEAGEDLLRVGAHVQGVNNISVGVCLIGGVNFRGESEFNYTSAQMIAAKALNTGLKAMFPGVAIRGHRDFSADLDGNGEIESHEFMKMCPCFNAGPTFETGEVDLDPVDHRKSLWSWI